MSAVDSFVRDQHDGSKSCIPRTYTMPFSSLCGSLYLRIGAIRFRLLWSCHCQFSPPSALCQLPFPLGFAVPYFLKWVFQPFLSLGNWATLTTYYTALNAYSASRWQFLKARHHDKSDLVSLRCILISPFIYVPVMFDICSFRNDMLWLQVVAEYSQWWSHELDSVEKSQLSRHTVPHIRAWDVPLKWRGEAGNLPKTHTPHVCIIFASYLLYNSWS